MPPTDKPASQRRAAEYARSVRPRIVVKFRDQVTLPYEKGAERALEKLGLAPWRKLAEAAPGITLEPVFASVTPTRLRELVRTARQRNPSFRPQNLFGFYAVAYVAGMDLNATAQEVRSWPVVEHAYIDRGPTPPPAVNAANDPRWPMQGHLDPAPIGVDAEYAWLLAGGDGEGQNFVDLEYGWRLTHEELAPHGVSIISGQNTDYVEYHGTAVLGVVCGADNTTGGVGVTPHLGSVRVVSEQRSEALFSTADAVVSALDVMAPGDVLLIESQFIDDSAADLGFLPRDAQPDVYAATSLGTALGVIIVEAAGNGGNDLDLYEHPSLGQIFNPASDDFLDSGVIMVGAARSFVPHPRISGSNYGGRIDCYAWGEDVDTATAFDDGPDNLYEPDFGGTSAASAIIAGCALAVQGISENIVDFKFSPGQLRALFRNPDFGTPSEDPPTDRIGPMPDLQAIVNGLYHTQPDLYFRDFPGDTGDPHDGPISASPDIILRPALVDDAEAEFGEGSPGENSSTLGSTAIAGQDNFVYVRVLNQSAFAPTTDVTATVYWSPPATLVSPSMWTLVGSVEIPVVPGADVLTVAEPIVWSAEDIPESGHYCFVGLVGNVQDPAPSPISFGDFDTYRDYIRNNNNVTWRNFNVADNAPDEGSEFKSLRFLAAGADDLTRHFCLEVISKLPRGSKCQIEGPLALLQAMQAMTLGVVGEGDTVRIPINPHGRHRIGCAWFPPKHAFPLELLVHIPEEHRDRRWSVAVRQLYEGEEVGRVTWRLVPAP